MMVIRHAAMCAWLLAVAISSLTFPTSALVAASVEPGAVEIDVVDGLVTLSAKDTQLGDVLLSLSRLAGFEVIGLDRVHGTITVSFERLPVRDALDRLVGNASRVVVLAPASDGKRTRAVSQVLILGSLGAPALPPPPTGTPVRAHEHAYTEAKLRSEAILTSGPADDADARRALLVQSLHTDEDPLVRARAAIGLGALGDEGTVPDLEAALEDEHATVRAQALGALAHIGGARAVAALGRVLLNASEGRERVIAVMALARQRTVLADHFLETALQDPEIAVRQAVRRALERGAPSPVGAAPSTNWLGAERLQ